MSTQNEREYFIQGLACAAALQSKGLGTGIMPLHGRLCKKWGLKTSNRELVEAIASEIIGEPVHLSTPDAAPADPQAPPVTRPAPVADVLDHVLTAVWDLNAMTVSPALTDGLSNVMVEVHRAKVQAQEAAMVRMQHCCFCGAQRPSDNDTALTDWGCIMWHGPRVPAGKPRWVNEEDKVFQFSIVIDGPPKQTIMVETIGWACPSCFSAHNRTAEELG